MNCLHIIFSKDRALQLKAQLDSIRMFVRGSIKHVVLWTSSPEHSESYSKVISEYPDFLFIKEKDFKLNVQSLLYCASEPYVFFTPDDGLFIRKVDIDDLATPAIIRDFIVSLRLGDHLTKSHPVGNKDQALPLFSHREIFDDGNLTFDWNEGVFDWGYPLALDGHIFDRRQMLGWLCLLQFRSPTSLEIQLQQFKALHFKKGLCKTSSSFVSLPWNAVTDEIANLNGGTGTDVFLSAFEDGKKIATDHIYGSLPVSCHQEYPLEFVK